MECGSQLIRTLLIIFNLIFLTFGLILLGCGSKYVSNIEELRNLVGPFVLAGPIGVIIIGIFIVVISFAGFYGACRENKHILGLYTIVLILLVILCVLAALYSFKMDSINEKITKRVYEQFDKYISDKIAQLAFTAIESWLSCCGTRGPDDYKSIFAEGKLPPSCCEDEVSECLITSGKVVHQRGCVTLITDFTTAMTKVLSIISIFAAIIMGTCICFTVYLYFTIHSD